MRHDTIKTMTIVTNQGDVRYISKGEHFDYNGAVELMRECQEKYSDNINKCIDLFKKNAILLAYREGNIEAGGVSMDGILDGKPGMTIDELIALLEKGPIKAESNNEDKA